MIKLGAGGSYNLQQHIDSAACHAAANKVTRKPPKKDGTLLGFLQKKVPLVPSKAPTLSNIHAPKILNSPNPPKLAPSSPSLTRASSIPSSSLPTQTQEPCTTAICLLDHLREKLNQIPTTEPEATETHRLASFAADAESYVLGDPQDDWENVLNPMFHQAFGWGEDTTLQGLVQRGRYGLDGFVKFVGYFVELRGLEDGFIREKIEKLIEAIDAR